MSATAFKDLNELQIAVLNIIRARLLFPKRTFEKRLNFCTL